MNHTLRLVFIAAALASLAGCGNKGPLVLPTPPAPIDPATVPETPVDPVPAEGTPADTAPTETPAAQPTTDTSITPTETPVPATTDGDGNG